MSKKSRVETLRVMMASHAGMANSSRQTAIIGELNRIVAAARIPKHNGWLLTLLHATRTLDSTLNELIKYKGWHTYNENNLRSYLRLLSAHHVLTSAERQLYEREIVHRRNRYMHEAGAMPDRRESDKVVNEVHACLSQILRRL